MKPIATPSPPQTSRSIESAPPVSSTVRDRGDLNAATGIIRAILIGLLMWIALLVSLAID